MKKMSLNNGKKDDLYEILKVGVACNQRSERSASSERAPIDFMDPENGELALECILWAIENIKSGKLRRDRFIGQSPLLVIINPEQYLKLSLKALADNAHKIYALKRVVESMETTLNKEKNNEKAREEKGL